MKKPDVMALPRSVTKKDRPTKVMLGAPCSPEMLAQMKAENPDLVLTFLRDTPDGVPQGAAWIDKTSLSDTAEVTLTSAQEEFHDTMMRALMADSRSYFLLERLMRDAASGTAFNGMTRVDLYVRRAIRILDEHDPERVIFMSTPHNMKWFFARVAEARGCDIIVLTPAPFPGSIFVTHGMDAQQVLETEAGDAATAREMARDFIATRQRSYAEAEPDYERVRRESYGESFFSLRAELREAFISKTPRAAMHKLALTHRKSAALRLYESLAITKLNPAQAGRAVVLFLHYQPERSSLPEGGDYAQQFRIARSLAAALPEGWELLIKDHPSQYRRPFKPRVRDQAFYQALAGIKNTRLVDLSMDTFALIDHAAAVATITGTVGLEAICRGTPAMVFGCASYQGAPGVTRVTTLAETHAALADIAQGARPNPEAVEDWMNWAALHSHAAQNGDRGYAWRCAILSAVLAPLNTAHPQQD